MAKTSPLTWVEVDLKAIAHNFHAIKKLCRSQGKKPIASLVVVKADAYGHGMVKVAKLVTSLGNNFLGVSDLQEGVTLRESGIKKPILLFESTLSAHAKDIFKYKLIPTVCTLDFAKTLNRIAKEKKKRFDIHVKVDTGMGRLGVWHKDAPEFISELDKLKFLAIKGIYTHFPCADTDKEFTKKQVIQLYDLVKRLDTSIAIVPYIHASNSMGLAGYKTHILNLARPGIMLYGLLPSQKLASRVSLKPAMSVKSKIVFIKKIQKGRSISYGRTFIAKKSMTVATLSIGYNDGYLRSFSNKGHVLVGGVRCRVLGRVTMDQIVVDITKVKNSRLGMTVTVLGREKNKSVTAEELGQAAGTINYEIVCGLGNRLPRVYKK